MYKSTPTRTLRALGAPLAGARGRLGELRIVERHSLHVLHRVGEFAVAGLRDHPLIGHLAAADVAVVAIFNLRRINAEHRFVVVDEAREIPGFLFEERLDLWQVARL